MYCWNPSHPVLSRMNSFYTFPLLRCWGGRLCLCKGPSTQELYKHLNLRVSKTERKRVMDRRGDLLSAKGSGGGVGSASPGPPTLPGRPSVATIPAPSSSRESPAWLLPTPGGLRAQRRMPRPEMPSCSANPDRAPLSCRPLPQGWARRPRIPGLAWPP